MIDLTLAGGEVFDGSGGGAFRADVGILDGRIACIGDLSGQESAERIELNGLAVCPGFIDLHTHSDFTLLVNGRAESQVHQGVTTRPSASADIAVPLSPAPGTRDTAPSDTPTTVPSTWAGRASANTSNASIRAGWA